MLWHELRKQRGTSNSMILVPLFDLKFLTEFAAGGMGTSNRRHYCRSHTNPVYWYHPAPSFQRTRCTHGSAQSPQSEQKPSPGTTQSVPGLSSCACYLSVKNDGVAGCFYLRGERLRCAPQQRRSPQ